MSDRAPEGSGTENPVLDNPLPGLEEMLRDAAADARRRAFVPSYDLVEGAARGRRTARVAASSLFGAVLCVSLGVGVAFGVGRIDREPDHRPPAAVAVTLDPSLRQYQTKIPILTWTPDPDGPRVDETQFQDAVFAEMSPGDKDYTGLDDLRKRFPNAPVGGPAILIEQSTTKAQLERAAANLRKLEGVRAVRVIEVTGLWFTMSATGLLSNKKPQASEPPSYIGFTGAAGGGNRVTKWVRNSYIGPPITTDTFELMRRMTADEVYADISQVVITAESGAPKPSPAKS